MTSIFLSVWPIVLIFLGAVLLSVALTVILSASIRRRHLRTAPPAASPCGKTMSGSRPSSSKPPFSAPSPVVRPSAASLSPLEPSEPISAFSDGVPDAPEISSVSPVLAAEPAPEAAPAESAEPAAEVFPRDGTDLFETEEML